MDHLIDVVHWFMIALFVGWTLFFLFCLFRFRASVHPQASYHGVRKPRPCRMRQRSGTESSSRGAAGKGGGTCEGSGGGGT